MNVELLFHHDMGEGPYFGDGGFAYRPAGPAAELADGLESPRFRSLGDRWYVWTESC